MKPTVSGTLISAGCDWLTVTCRQGSEVERLREIAFSIAECELAANMFGKPWSASGYQGFSVGGVQYGERDDSVICRLTSVVAHAHHKRVLQCATNTTRVDLQMTIKTTENPATVIRRHHDEMELKNRKRKKPLRLRIMSNEEDSVTVYSGHPQSNVSLRIYDKGRESKKSHYQGCVRYETKTQGRVAKKVGSQLQHTISQASLTLPLILAFASNRGCRLTNLSKSLNVTASIDGFRLSARLSDRDKVLQWLRKSVSPSVRLLLEREGPDAVLNALGLCGPSLKNAVGL